MTNPFIAARQFFRDFRRFRALESAKREDRNDPDYKNKRPIVKNVGHMRAFIEDLSASYDPEAEFAEAINKTHPALAFITALEAGHAVISGASVILEAKRKDGVWARESLRVKKAAKAGTCKEAFNFDADAQYDSAQYTEFVPIMGGPFNKQLYLQNMLEQHAKVFEAVNHNPVASRAISIYKQYILGAGYKVHSKNPEAVKRWKAYSKKYRIDYKLRKFWLPNLLKYGEIFIDLVTKRGIDSSTIWEIVTNPENCDEVYYYHQQYPTAYQLYTGINVPGVKDSTKPRPTEYVIRQLPYYQVIHIKSNCEENEKRGRSYLYPVIGWLKRLKDLFNAEVIKAWLGASFIWDDTLDGEQADIDAHISRYSSMPKAGSVFAHNKAVERKPMPAVSGAQQFAYQVIEALIALIATGLGIPKEWFNISGGGNRATAVMASEPFAKAVDEAQEDLLILLNLLAADCWKEASEEYADELEFIFPEMTGDTTSEKIKNVALGEEQGYISHETAATMYAAEMKIATYDYQQEQAEITATKNAAANGAAADLLPGGGHSHDEPPADPGAEPPAKPSIHGAGAADIKAQLKA